MSDTQTTVQKFCGFPENLTLDELRTCTSDIKEIRECKFDGYSIFSYFFTRSDTFPDPTQVTGEKRRNYQIRRECRGLVFNQKTGEIISRRYHKFFNLGERPETKIEAIDWSRDFIILEKLDGSMVVVYNNQLHFGLKINLFSVQNLEFPSPETKPTNML